MKLTNLQTNFLRKNNKYFEIIDSTQKEIWKMYEQGEENGSLVMAGIQTKGIGTHGRTWHTDEKENIAFSFFIQPECNIQQLDGITRKIAQIILEIFQTRYGIEVEIKEPNDIVYNGKKIGGILTQTRVSNEKVDVIVVGIGINTSQEKFSEDIKDIATSIKNEFGITVDCKEFIEQFCLMFENELNNKQVI